MNGTRRAVVQPVGFARCGEMLHNFCYKKSYILYIAGRTQRQYNYFITKETKRCRGKRAECARRGLFRRFASAGDDGRKDGTAVPVDPAGNRRDKSRRKKTLRESLSPLCRRRCLMKGKRWWIVCAVVLALCGIVLVVFRESVNPALGRNRDEEFRQGSGIELGTLDAAQEENLYKLAKVWGFVKYYHPDIIAGDINWDAELFRVMPQVAAAESPAEVNRVLYDWLCGFPYEETPQAATSETAAFWRMLEEQNGSITADLSWISDRAVWGADLCAYLEGLSRLEISDRRNGYAAFQGEGTGEKVSFAAEQDYPLQDADDGVKLLAVFRLWNAFAYCSPYLALTDGDWDEALRQGIHAMLGAESKPDYVLVLGKMMAKTGDVHVTFGGGRNYLDEYFGEENLPCHCMILEGRAVVDAVAEGEQTLQKGDVITAVDGVSMADRLAELGTVLPVPEPGKYGYWFCIALLRTAGPTAQVTVEREGTPMTLTVQTRPACFVPENPWKNGRIEDGQIGYIDPGALKDGDVERLMEDFADTEGIIVDLREYPAYPIVYLLGEYLIPELRQFIAFDFPDPLRPGNFYRMPNYTGAGYSKMMGLSDRDDYPLYEGKVVLLINEFSQSQSETTAMALRQAPRAVVVGSPSIGADGDIVEIKLPAGVQVVFSSFGVYTPEGETIQRVGVQPDIFCRPTAQDLRQGRDVLMETAVDLILSADP